LETPAASALGGAKIRSPEVARLTNGLFWLENRSVSESSAGAGVPDRSREQRLRALERGEAFSIGRGDPDTAMRVHLRLADRAMRAERDYDALEHYRAARVLLEAAVR
jgi:hypothetical protein